MRWFTVREIDSDLFTMGKGILKVYYPNRVSYVIFLKIAWTELIKKYTLPKN